MPRKDRVQVGILGDAFERYMGARIDEARMWVGAWAVLGVSGLVRALDLMRMELGGQQPLPRNGDRHPAGVDA